MKERIHLRAASATVSAIKSSSATARLADPRSTAEVPSLEFTGNERPLSCTFRTDQRRPQWWDVTTAE